MENKQIICGKCEAVLQTLPESFAHLIVTSPPYNVSIPYDGYEDNLSEEDYYKWVREWVKGCYRILIDGGRICINIPNIVDKYIPILKEAGFTMRDTIIWVKSYDEKGETFCGGDTSWGSWLSPNNPFCRIFSELILIAHKTSPSRGRTEKNDITPQEFMQYTRNVWIFPTDSVGQGEHPAPFPVELPKRLIKLYTWPEDIVLDPFCGRGTTLEAAEMLGRKWIGIDSSLNYCEIARRNVERYQFQSKLTSFTEEEKEKAPEIKLEDFQGG